jgi:hypothetical protein
VHLGFTSNKVQQNPVQTIDSARRFHQLDIYYIDLCQKSFVLIIFIELDFFRIEKYPESLMNNICTVVLNILNKLILAH